MIPTTKRNNKVREAIRLIITDFYPQGTPWMFLDTWRKLIKEKLQNKKILLSNIQVGKILTEFNAETLKLHWKLGNRHYSSLTLRRIS